jgi:hypothetical protein
MHHDIDIIVAKGDALKRHIIINTHVATSLTLHRQGLHQCGHHRHPHQHTAATTTSGGVVLM